MADDFPAGDVEDILQQFDNLIEEVLGRNFQRACFRPWEIALLVDIATCDVPMAVLREYRIAARHQLRNGDRLPMKLSDYLAKRSSVSGDVSGEVNGRREVMKAKL